MTQFNKTFELRNALIKNSADGKHYYLTGYASDTSLDRDGDRMSPKALREMRLAVESGMNLYLDHEHGIFDSVGVLSKAEEQNGRLYVEARLEDPEISEKSRLLLHKLEIGERIGLSIGGDMTEHHYETNELGKRVRVIDGVTLYEISAVGIPSNANAYILGSVFKSASFDAQQRGVNAPAKIPAEPGISGSSQVYRTDVGPIDVGKQELGVDNDGNANETDSFGVEHELKADGEHDPMACRACLHSARTTKSLQNMLAKKLRR